MTLFIKKFEKLLKSNDFEIWYEKELFQLYKENEQENNWWLKMKYYEMLRNMDNNLWDLLHFIKYIWKNNWFTDNDLIKSFKNEILNSDKIYTKNFYLSCLYSINIHDNSYYEELYDKIIDTNKFNIDTAEIFLWIFIDNHNFERFISCSIFIIYNRKTSLDDDRIWKYLSESKNIKFKKWILKIFDYFTKNKKNPENFYDYKWIIDFDSRNESEDYWFYRDKKDIIDKLLSRIEWTIFNKKEQRIILDFLFSELNIYVGHYSDIEKNYFYKKIFTALCSKDNSIIIDFLKAVNLKHLTYSSNIKFICNFLNEDNISKCMNIYKNSDSKDFYNIYYYLKELDKKNVITCIKKDKLLFKILLDIEKEKNKNKEKWENENKIREQKRKDDLFMRLNLLYDFKFLQDYEHYLRDKTILTSITTEEEKLLNEAAKRQSLNYLKRINIKNYSDKKIKELIHFEKKSENSYTVSQTDQLLYLIFRLSRSLGFNISCYYKLFVLCIPFFHWNLLRNEIFPFIKDKINKQDINFLLKLFSTDLNENTKWLRFYNTDSFAFLCNMLVKSQSLSRSQLKKIKSITIDFIESENIQYKWQLIELLSQIIKRKSDFKKYYQEPNINYFKSIISNEVPISEEDKNEFEKQFKFNEALIIKYNDYDALIRRINQLKDGVVKCEDSFKDFDESWNIVLWRWITKLEEELRFSSGSYLNLSYLVKECKSEKIKNQMLNLFEIWLEISEKEQFRLYAQYLVNIFSKYIMNIKENRSYNLKIINLIERYPNNTLYLHDIKKFCYIDDTQLNNTNTSIYDNEIILKYKNKLNILYQLLDIKECKWIVFCEWWTDKTILETARSKLYPWVKKSFFIQPSWWARTIKVCINSWFTWYNIWLFDFDNEWIYQFENFKRWYTIDLGGDYSGLFRYNIEWKKYLLTLPVPILKKWVASEKLWKHSLLNIENMFNEDVFDKFFSENIYWWVINDWNIIKLEWNDKIYLTEYEDQKENFSLFVNTLNYNDFKNFIPLFNLINKIITWEFE